MKYANSKICLSEVPNEVSLCISIMGCKKHCEGCHSPELWDTNYKKTGSILSYKSLDALLQYHNHISCVCFLGGEWEVNNLIKFINYIKKQYDLKVALYTGETLEELKEHQELIDKLDYIKTGPYIRELGSIVFETTNQRFYKKDEHNNLVDITSRFWIYH